MFFCGIDCFLGAASGLLLVVPFSGFLIFSFAFSFSYYLFLSFGFLLAFFFLFLVIASCFFFVIFLPVSCGLQSASCLLRSVFALGLPFAAFNFLLLVDYNVLPAHCFQPFCCLLRPSCFFSLFFGGLVVVGVAILVTVVTFGPSDPTEKKERRKPERK